MTKTTPECPICTNEYGGKVVPTLLMCCCRDVCFICVEKDRNSQIAQLEGNRKKISCILCRQKYHCSKDTPWRVNHLFIEYSGIDADLTDVRETQAAMQGAALYNHRRGPRRSTTADANSSGDSDNARVINAATDVSGGQVGGADVSEDLDVSQDVDITSNDEESATSAKTDDEEEQDEGSPQQENSLHGPKRGEATNQIIQKPLFNEGDEVSALWEEDSKWYPGKVVSYEEVDSKSRYGTTRKYQIKFDDGDEGIVEDYNVFRREDCVLRHERAEIEWKGVKNVRDEESSDGWAKMNGWYAVTTVEGETLEFSSLFSAMQAYDASVRRHRGAQTKEEDLNLPDDQLNIRRGVASRSDSEANEPLLRTDRRERKRRKLQHSIDGDHALRKSSLIRRKQLACLTGGKVSKHQMGNPLNVGTPVTYCGGRAIATSNEFVHHICIKEAKNRPYPQNTREQFVMYRIAPKNGDKQQRDVQLLLRTPKHPPIPIFWEPANQIGKKKVTYLGHWKIAEIEDMSDRQFRYNGTNRCAKLYFDFNHFDERWEKIIGLCHDKTIEQMKTMNFEDL
eukprot:scaffold5845_cov73-Skeletonema_dohrnii-CCMP3373.AAC.3